MNFAQNSGGGSALGLLFPFILIFGIMYFLMFRPARNRQRKAVQVQASLTPGMKVMTTAGLYATVSSVEDDVVVLETAPGVLNRYARQAVLRVITESADSPHEQASTDQQASPDKQASHGPDETEPNT